MRELSRGEVQTTKDGTLKTDQDAVVLQEARKATMDGQTALRQAQTELRELRAESTELLVTKNALEAQLKIAQNKIDQLEQSTDALFLKKLNDLATQLTALTAAWGKDVLPVFVPPAPEKKS